MAAPSVLPDISPSSGEIGCHRWFRKSPHIAKSAIRPKLPISPLVGEMPSRAEGGAVLPSFPTKPGAAMTLE
ncbi:hypothetical protein EOD10_11840, partial [Mesorhizobium sp. M7A.T.Ca.TU.009.01.3.2]